MSSPSPPSPPTSDFSDSTDSDSSGPDFNYLLRRLGLHNEHKSKQHGLLFAKSNLIEKSFTSTEAKRRAASACEAVFESEKSRLKDLKISHSQILSAYEGARIEIEAQPLGMQALPTEMVNNFRRKEKEVAVSVELVKAQQITCNREEKVYLHSQHSANAAEAAVEEYHDIIGDLRKVNRMEVERKRKSARKGKRREVEAAKRLEDRQRGKTREYEEKLNESEMLAKSQRDVARSSHKIAADRVKTTTAVSHASKEYMEKAHLVNHENRIQATLELKANTDAANAAMKGANERNARRMKKKKEKQDKEFNDILKMGGNPYVEFKKRDVMRESEMEEKRERARILKQENELAAKMVKEDDYNRKKEEHLKMEKAYEDAYRGEQGREIIEARNRAYLMEKTTNGTDLIDPTRRVFKIEPSQVTTVQDASFGLGFNPRKDKDQLQDVIEMMKKKYPKTDAGEYSRLIPKKIELDEDVGDESNAAGLDGLVEPKTLPPGEDALATMNRTGLEDPEDDLGLTISMGSGMSSRATTPGTAASGMGKTGPAFPAKPLSMFEKNALKSAQSRQKDRLQKGQQQVAGGRTFRGQAFVAKPDTIMFKDFVLGKFYKRRILLTNVSLTFNNFKILDLPESITDFFEIVYERPGRMSAGMAVTLEITFMPKLNEDIVSELSFLSSTGPFSIPLVCLTQKVAPSVSTDVIRFDNIVMGERVTFPLKIGNNGAKSTMYYFVDPATGQRIPPRESLEAASIASPGKGSPKKPDISIMEDEEQEPEEIIYMKTEEELIKQSEAIGEACLEYPEGLSELQYSTIGSIGSYSETIHNITFAPLSPGRFKEERILQFDGTDETIRITIVATSIKLPIYVAEPVVDLRCCVYGKLYRKKVVIKNRGKISFKAHVKPPPELEDFVEFNPDMGFIQPDVDFEMQMKFRPTEDIIAKCGKYAIPGSEVIAVPMLVHVPEQALPVYYTLFARLTTGKVTFDQPMIDFKDCYVTQSYRKVIKLKNESRLPQKYGFVNLPKDVEVQPNDGFGALLPKQEKDIFVIMKPQAAVSRDFDLTVQTTMNLQSSVRLKCQGLESPLKLDRTVLKLSSCCPGDKICHSVFATNTTNSSQTFEFAVPEPAKSFLRITPNVESLEPGETVRLEIEFSPPENVAKEKSVVGEEGEEEKKGGEGGEGGDVKEGGEGEEGGEGQEVVVEEKEEVEDAPIPFCSGTILQSYRTDINEPWSVHSRWSLPCFLKTSTGSAPPLFLDVHTTLVKRVLEIDTSSVSFGQLAVGQVRVLPLRIRNLGSSPAPLIPTGLNSTGPFCIVNALLPILANSFHTISLQFAPLSQGVRSETLTLSCPSLGKTLTVVLKGEGVSPVLEVTPEGVSGLTSQNAVASITTLSTWTTTGQPCKHVAAGDTAKTTLSLKNASVFPLRYNVDDILPSTSNYSRKLPFTVSPSEATIQPGETKDLLVTFRPDHARVWSYKYEGIIAVPNQVEDHVIRCSGRCWEQQVYCCGSGDEGVTDEEDRVKEGLEDRFTLPSALGAVEEESLVSMGVVRPVRPDVVIKFPKEAEEGEEGKSLGILVGCLALEDAKKGGSGSYTVTIDVGNPSAKHFALTPASGTLAPGVEQRVEFSFTPPTAVNEGGIEVGQWTSVEVEVKGKGGWNGDVEKTWKVLLVGYINV